MSKRLPSGGGGAWEGKLGSEGWRRGGQSVGQGEGREVLKSDEVHQVAFGRSHAVREEVDQGVEELRPLGVRLVYVRESCEAAGNILIHQHLFWPSVGSLTASRCS